MPRAFPHFLHFPALLFFLCLLFKSYAYSLTYETRVFITKIVTMSTVYISRTLYCTHREITTKSRMNRKWCRKLIDKRYPEKLTERKKLAFHTLILLLCCLVVYFYVNILLTDWWVTLFVWFTMNLFIYFLFSPSQKFREKSLLTNVI